MIHQILNYIFQLYFILLIIRIIGSWLPQFQHSKFIRFVSFYTDPYLNFFRRFIPPLGGLDFSPIIAFFALRFIQGAINYLLFTLGL